MRHIASLLLSIVFFATAWFACKTPAPDPWKESSAFQQWCRFTFHSDSGYISDAQCSFLLQLTMRYEPQMFTPEYIQDLTDDSLFAERNIEHLDTFPKDSSGGKFYRVQLSGNVTRWMLCAFFPSTFDEDAYIFEILEEDGIYSVNDMTMFGHSNYFCGDGKSRDVFYRTGDWFLVNTCGTGTAFCCCQANLLFLPFHVDGDSIDKALPIPARFYAGMMAGGQTSGIISSQFFARHDTIFGNYQYQVDSTLYWNETLKEEVQKTVQQGHFTAVMKIDTVNRTVTLLNEKEIKQIKGIDWVFEASSY